MKRKIILTAFSLSTVLSTYSQNTFSDTLKPKARNPLVLNYSLLDSPFAGYASKTVDDKIWSDNKNSHGTFANSLKFKSFEQSIQIATGFAQTYQWGITQIPMFKKRPVLKKASEIVLSGVLDIALQGVPYVSGAWMHEEAHRSIMVNSYTSSYNPIIFFNKRKDVNTSSVASVSYVLDTNLVMMKKNNNANFIRLATSGIESQVAAVSYMQKNSFFYNSKSASSFYYFLQLLNVRQYISLCADKEESTKQTMGFLKKEGANQNIRDFAGLDLSAWAYDLNHPNEPYSARGLNTYGNGYDRYIYGDKLTDDQYKWLKKQANLSAINLITPALFYINSIKINSTTAFNFSGRYYPTSFGNQVGIELLLKTKNYNLFLAPHINQNKDHNFFGLEAMMFEKPMNVKGQHFLTTVRVIADMQPKNQEFTTAKAAFTCLGGATVYWRASKHLRPYLSLEAKNSGWVAANSFLDPKFSVKVGLSLRFNQN